MQFSWTYFDKEYSKEAEYSNDRIKQTYSNQDSWKLLKVSQANSNQIQKQVFYCAPSSLTPATGEVKLTQESPIHISG